MQRKSLFNIICLLFSILLTGCTLSMEEYAIEEEMSRGFDEPYTEVTDVGTFTYQYQENVRPITKHVLDYVLGVECDSIVYFVESCPPEWLPKVGGYVSCGISRKIPNGLCNRVLSVEHQDGHYKVTTTKAKTDEVFKELDIDITFEYQAPNLSDSAVAKNAQLEQQDSVTIDWGLIDNGAVTRAFTPTPTRGEGDENKEDENKEDKDVESEDKMEDVSTLEWPIKEDIQPVGDKQWHIYLEGSVKKVVRKLVHYRAVKHNNLCESWDEDHSYTVHKIEAGAYYGVKDKMEESNPKLRNFFETLKHKEKNPYTPKSPFGNKIPPVRVLIGGPTALFVVFEFGFDLNFVVKGYGKAEWTTYEPVKKTGKIEEDGKKEQKIDGVVNKGHSECSELSINGELELTVAFKASLSIEHASGVGAGVEVSLGTTITLGTSVHWSNSTPGAYVVDKDNREVMSAPALTKNYSSDCQLKISIDFEASVIFYVSPFGFTLFKGSLTIAKYNILTKVIDFGLTLNQKKSYLKNYTLAQAIGEVSGRYDVVLEPYYEYEELGVTMENGLPNYPRLRFYNNDHTKFFDLLPKDYNGAENKIAKNKKYEFSIKKTDALKRLGEEFYCYVVPVYCDNEAFNDETIVLKDYEQIIGEYITPSLSIESLEQVFAKLPTDLEDPGMVLKRMGLNYLDPEYYSIMTCYSFRTVLRLMYPESIEKWGITIDVCRKSNHKSLRCQDFVIGDVSKNQVIRDGVYTIRNEFLSQYSEWNFDYDGHFNDQLYVTVKPFIYYKKDYNKTQKKSYDKKTLYLEGSMNGEENLLDYETLTTSGIDVR